MKFGNVVKYGTLISVLLFGMAMVYYVIMRLDMTGRNREVNLFSFIPSDCVGVLESDDINAFLNDCQMCNYSTELDMLRFSGVFHFLLDELNEYATENGHGLSSQMSHLAVSFHQPSGSRDQVVYFRMGVTDEQMLLDVLQEYTSSHFLPREEIYRGRLIRIYPLNADEFLATYAENGAFVMSYQKRLIEKVIDARLDGLTLDENKIFSEVKDRRKGKDLLTFYGHSAAMPFLDVDSECWSEYGFHMNSDVVYLMGETYTDNGLSYVDQAVERICEVETFKAEKLLVSSDKDSTELYVNRAIEAVSGDMPTLFDECVANLSTDVAFTLVTDMQEVVSSPFEFRKYLPSFMLEHAALFHRFNLSVQVSMDEERSSHIWVFTYKD